MLAIQRIINISFLGAVLILLIPPIFFIGISDGHEMIGVGFQFLTGWIFLGISMYYHSKFYLKYKERRKIIGLSFLLLLILTILKLLLILTLKDVLTLENNASVPVIPENIIQNTILSMISLIYVTQYFQRKRNEANHLKIMHLENENLQLQLKSLQQQLNPHFFFNSLNTLTELIYIDIEKSEAYINELSQVFRYTLDMQQQSLISLEKELNFIQSYFFLLKIRFEDKLHLDSEIENTTDYKIPSLSLLVLFENAIKHNAISERKPMNISLTLKDEYLMVKNNKNTLPQLKHPSLGIGLENLNNRSLLLTQKPCIIENEAFFFTVKIPIIKNDKHNHH